MFAERWFAGTQLVSGTFFLEGDGVTPAQILAHVDPLYREIRRHQRSRWPRGLAGFFVIPILCSSNFDPELTAWVRTRHPYKWAIWLEPLLYDCGANTVALREDYHIFGRAFFPHLNHLFTTGLGRAAAHFGHSNLPQKENA